MKKYNLLISNTAESDLFEIGNDIASELFEPATAQYLVNKIGMTILELEQIPYRGGLVADEELAAQGIRKVLVDNYIVFYVVSENRETVTVVRILYGKRNWASLL